MSFTLLHYSDPHFGASVAEISKAAVQIAHELEPDLLVISGDFAMKGRRREFQAAREWLSRLPAPRLVIPGNHDVPALNNLWQRFFAPFKRYKHFIHPSLEPSRDLPGVGKLVSANSNLPFGWHRDWSHGFLNPMQAQRIHRELLGVPAERLRLLTLHHPLLAAKDKERALVAPLPLVSKMLTDNAIDLALTGHFHQSSLALFPAKNSERKIVVSQAPSICSTRRKGEPNGFHLLHLSPGKICGELFQWEGKKFLRQSAHRFSRTAEGWQEDLPARPSGSSPDERC
ncbi:metallophosphoesterase family protein [Roseibacillus ishigakijimensis]|uniref:Metallophosphoesterase n=1 Tax=Roseibacillus ishigakijimensis TaxID=454146 RepID=A0A934VHE1_9BACT|nr:metallophosphoesterase [Roseibacillus ishigakijimensis]MBK1833853.1 metallophosphoesterase [Roseibacillus ishigakijimensis]